MPTPRDAAYYAGATYYRVAGSADHPLPDFLAPSPGPVPFFTPLPTVNADTGLLESSGNPAHPYRHYIHRCDILARVPQAGLVSVERITPRSHDAHLLTLPEASSFGGWSVARLEVVYYDICRARQHHVMKLVGTGGPLYPLDVPLIPMRTVPMKQSAAAVTVPAAMAAFTSDRTLRIEDLRWADTLVAATSAVAADAWLAHLISVGALFLMTEAES